MPRLIGHDELVDAVAVCDAEQDAQAQRRVVGAVERDLVLHGRGLVEQRADIGTGQTARHETEGSQRRVAAADVGIGVEHAVASGCRFLVERRARIGDDDDVVGRGVRPASVNACSYARRWLSVSIVPPDLLATTTMLRSSRSAIADRTMSGCDESSTVSGTPAVWQMTSGASDEPPMPQSTT